MIMVETLFAGGIQGFNHIVHSSFFVGEKLIPDKMKYSTRDKDEKGCSSKNNPRRKKHEN
ncbi:hypothetical protein [Bacillus andreraoultii]|uniref:hypothetical protein n=1 Tax=Bacillus andreraoultii TaxID=1499685 RepID=UPI00053B685F|nr:hypothetical protein [Bacillus andreraoultii]